MYFQTQENFYESNKGKDFEDVARLSTRVTAYRNFHMDKAGGVIELSFARSR